MVEKIRVLAQLARMVAKQAPDEPLALRMCRASVSILGADGGDLTLAYQDRARMTVCATDQTAARLADLQEVTGEGPSHDASRTGQLVQTSFDEAALRRWPAFGRAVRMAFRTVTMYAIPVLPNSHVVGVLTLYQIERRDLLRDDETSQLLVNAVGVSLMNDLLIEDPEACSTAWPDRSRTHQATGMVMAQLGLSPDDALALLRAHAYAHDTSLAAISQDVIERRLDFATTDLPEDEVK